jgi:HD superfamily phosphohydrolase
MPYDPRKTYEFRCPVHGFVKVNDWERAIVDTPAFQRLRRIRQLAWTEYVYPGATHTRFEHSLGVMHTATRIYDAVCERSADLLQSELAYNDDGLRRDRQLVRLAALLHDVGHTPFSHAAEDLFPEKSPGKRFLHEDYSTAIIRTTLKDVIEKHPRNANYGFRADDVAALIEGSGTARQALFWRELISGQMDADRMDYLLRDSHHAGVQYGRFDLNRIVSTVTALKDPESETLRLGVTEGGAHAAERLVLARYEMFTQVYFHKTRVAYDHHLKNALSEILPSSVFPRPDTELDAFLDWDDWKVVGLLKEGNGGEHGKRLADRQHYRSVYHTPESPDAEDMKRLQDMKSALAQWIAAEMSATKSWYKAGPSDILVSSEAEENRVEFLSMHSSVIGSLKANGQILLYVRPEDAAAARLEKSSMPSASASAVQLTLTLNKGE